MLTDSEQKWLNDREIVHAGCGCYIWDSYYWNEDLPFEDMKEAAEFESRVAAKLLIMPAYKSPCRYGEAGLCSFADCADMDCEDARLKWARLAVEEEMNAKS